MQGYIMRVSGVIPNTLKEVDINLNGRNLIITGSNGSGKTSFLREVYRKTDLLIAKKKQADLNQLKKNYEQQKNHWETNTVKGTTQYDQFQRIVKNAKSELDSIMIGLHIEIPENLNFSSRLDDKVAILKLFEATRTANILHADTAHGILSEQEKKSSDVSQNLGNNLEQHLVNLKNRRSLAISEDKNFELSEKISMWFSHFEKNLKELMEDQSTNLQFNSDTLKFSINQNGKPPYTFQKLSSGYLAIFDIYADLLMRTEYFKVTPEELRGVVFIDEIDAHLHVSLQRQILPFFTKSFPNVQFIVTTHSPFVLMSVNDLVIFDISKNFQIEEDLSLYSYSAVMEGLLGTKPTSKILDEIIMDIANISKSDNINYDRLNFLINKIKPLEDKLDSRSKAFYMVGINALLDRSN